MSYSGAAINSIMKPNPHMWEPLTLLFLFFVYEGLVSNDTTECLQSCTCAFHMEYAHATVLVIRNHKHHTSVHNQPGWSMEQAN